MKEDNKAHFLVLIMNEIISEAKHAHKSNKDKLIVNYSSDSRPIHDVYIALNNLNIFTDNIIIRLLYRVAQK